MNQKWNTLLTNLQLVVSKGSINECFGQASPPSAGGAGYPLYLFLQPLRSGKKRMPLLSLLRGCAKKQSINYHFVLQNKN